MLEQAREHARERRLGSDGRAGRRVRGEVRRIQWAYVRRNWRFLGSGAAIGALAIAIVACIAPHGFLRGAVVGAGVVFVLCGLAFVVVQLTGTGPQAMGATGEMWTSSELRPLRKLGWKLVDHVFYRYGDIDHLLVGAGGVIVAESKWSAEAWNLNAPNAKLTRAIEQLKRGSRDVRLVLPQLRNREGSVRPMLFLWGGGRTGGEQPSDPIRIDGVDVIYGVAAAKVWRDHMESVPVLFEAAEVDDIWSRLRAQADATDRQDNAAPAPPSLAQLYWTALATLTTAFVGVLGEVSAIRVTGELWAGYLFAAVAAITGVAAHRVQLLRHLALGWLTGVGVVTILLVMLQLFG